ncbi:MAG TPA: hypothetical protein PLX99_10450, partial [Gammaproteobacteria bacterium]|nr:hypothetical protein [Gammaproteobacteria bacterium]
MKILTFSLATVLLLAVQGCQTIKQTDIAPGAAAEVPGAPAPVLPFAEPAPVARELDEDLVF